MLRDKATKAVKWSAIDQLVRKGFLFIGSIILARLIAPEQFGTLALLTLFTGVAGLFVDGGFSAALIQKGKVSAEDESTVFWFNLGMGTVMAGTLFLAAPWIAEFFSAPVLLPISRIYSAQFILGASTSVHGTLFTRSLDFKTPLIISLCASIPSIILGIVLAFHDFAIWALVAQAMSGAVLGCFFTWLISKWRPRFVFSGKSFRALTGYGGFYFAARFLDTLYKRIYTLTIGRWFGVYELGIYNRAKATTHLPTQTFSSVLSKVAFPFLSRVQDDRKEMKRLFRMAIRGAMFINIPMMLGLALVAEPLVLTLLGSAWIKSAPILQVLSLGGILWPLHLLNLNVLQAMGHSDKFFKLELIKKSIGLTIIVIASSQGVMGLAWGMVTASVISAFLNTYYTGKMLNYGLWKQFADVASAAGCGVVMVVVVVICKGLFGYPALVQLLLLSSSGFVSYVVCAKLFRVPELEEAYRFLRGKVV